ncbi:helix-turn-helix domain-containing protein [Pandoraea apista]|uniref:helix-turn-helix domain-containing protein n=1 Tax=Pandoraea apista TaxID=93218 RepID=UPI0021AD8892|nr:LysR family transcriptional regulator [Pandoraea apista]
MTRNIGARNESELLRAIARTKQVRAAARLGVNPSTINRRIDDLKEACLTLASFGLQINPVSSMTFDRMEQIVLEGFAIKYLEAQRNERLVGF